MESARSAFHAQLATVMDSLLAAAVCEIAKIFEGSLREQQEELVQKSEEISVLRGRLEKAEKKHRAKVGAGDQGELSSGDREGRGKQHRPTPSGLRASVCDLRQNKCRPIIMIIIYLDL